MADYPTNDPSDGSLLIAANNVSSTLNGGISSGATSMTLASSANFPAKGGVTIESEAIIYTANDTATSVLSGLTRGADSTTAAIHSNGTAVYGHMQARHHNAVKDEIIAMGADLRNIFKQDLDDTQAVSTTAATLKMRVDQLSTRIAALGNSSDWKTGYPGKVRAMTMGTLDTAFSTSATAFTSTGLQVTISLATTTSRVFVTAHGEIGVNTMSADAGIFTMLRGTTNLGSSNGFGVLNLQNIGATGAAQTPCSMQYLDSPSTNGSVTYAVAIKTSGGGTAVTFGRGSARSVIIATEVMA